MESPHFKYFVGHKKPEFPIWNNFTFYEVDKTSNVSINSSFKKNSLNDKVFGEYSSLFALKNELKSKKEEGGLITICQYRRFVFNKKLGRQSDVMPWARVLSQNEVLSMDVQNEFLPLRNNLYLIGSAIQIPSILVQYSQHHFLRDILKFSSILIDAEILPNETVLDFLNQPYLIPSPSIGTFTLKSFIEIFDMLELAANRFWNAGYRPYEDPYQCRVIGFLLERLNSYLLISYLNESSLNINDLFGCTTMVSAVSASNNDVQRGLVEL